MEKIAQFWLLLHLVVVAAAVTPNPLPLNCSDSNRVCTSFLAFSPSQRQTLADVQSMFDVLPADITSDDGPAPTPYLYVRKNCSCSAPTKRYLTNTTFTVREDGASVYDAVIAAYHGLAVLTNTSRPARAGAVVSLHLFCGCSSGLWNYLMSYVMQPEDSLELLASRFGVSMESIEAVNTIADPSNVTTGALYFIPLNSVPGLPYSSNQPPAPSPGVPSSSEITFPAKKGKHSSQFPYGWILGILGVGLVIIVVGVLTFILCKSRICCNNIERNGEKDGDSTISHKFHILRRPSFCSGSRRYFCCNSEKCKPATLDVPGNQVDRHIPKAIVTEVFDVERPVTFTYQEILSSTDGFSESNLLGHGTYGSVYYGILRDLEVSIKRMTATKTKEFLAEMKVLCKVHHMNLVELIGYAATDDELFLIYEYAQKGSLKNHLHDPQNKGHTPLSWIARVQIALDAARGLEYIHEHTKSHYVHRDIKTSNILLDGSLRAKISDFGLSKLVGKTNDGEVSVTRVVGTFGYLAPEYLNDGLATTKSDVYAFGVVLFELLTGKEAITRTETRTSANSERRSLASIMLAVLKNSPSSLSMGSLKESIDPNLLDLYPHDCAYKLATLAKQCVDEEPVLRPDMKEIVISLSQILLSSIEWEATLAGNSQVFSGLVQGR